MLSSSYPDYDDGDDDDDDDDNKSDLNILAINWQLMMYLFIFWFHHASVNIPKRTDFERINPLKTKRRPLYLKTQPVPRCKHFSSRL